MISRARDTSAFTWTKLGLLVAFALVKLGAPWNKHPTLTGDGRIWARFAERDITSQEFWLARRPFTLPLVYKLLGGSDHALVWFQSGVAILSWGFLAYTVSTLLASPVLSVIGLFLVLALGLTSAIHTFDTVVRSESLGTSFLVLSLAATLTFIASERLPPLRKYAWLGVALTSAIASTFARETNAYFLPLLALFVAFSAWGKHRYAALALGLGLLVTTLSASFLTRASQRYDGPLMNVIFKRVLPSKGKLAYFRDELGMPVSAALMGRKGRWSSSDESLARKAPELADFRAWLLSSGYSGYQRYLLSHPLSTAKEAYDAFPRYVRTDTNALAPSVRRAARRSGNFVSSWLDVWLIRGPLWRFPLAACLGAFGVAVACAFTTQALPRRLAQFALLCWSGAVTQAYVCYHGDAMEVVRHGFIVGVLFRLAVLTSLLAAAALLLPRAVSAFRLARGRLSSNSRTLQSETSR